MLVLVAGTVALLYTWVQTSTPTQTQGYLQFMADVEGGKVTTAVQDGEMVTVTLSDGKTYTVLVPNPIFTNVATDMAEASAQGRSSRSPRRHTSESRRRTPRGSGCCSRACCRCSSSAASSSS